MSRKNQWRKAGRLQFRRETSRLSDGTPDGDVLFIRIHRRACVFATLGPVPPHEEIQFWANDGLYFKPVNPVQAANRMRAALYRKAGICAPAQSTN